MKQNNELKIFRKVSIEYLKRLNRRSMLFMAGIANNTLANENFKRLRMFNGSKQPFNRFTNEMAIFKAPVIVGLRIMYYRTYSFVFDHFHEDSCSDIGRDKGNGVK